MHSRQAVLGGGSTGGNRAGRVAATASKSWWAVCLLADTFVRAPDALHMSGSHAAKRPGRGAGQAALGSGRLGARCRHLWALTLHHARQSDGRRCSPTFLPRKCNPTWWQWCPARPPTLAVAAVQISWLARPVSARSPSQGRIQGHYKKSDVCKGGRGLNDYFSRRAPSMTSAGAPALHPRRQDTAFCMDEDPCCGAQRGTTAEQLRQAAGPLAEERSLVVGSSCLLSVHGNSH